MAYLLRDDERLARQEGDGQRVTRNLLALLNMADQLREGRVLIVDLVSLGIRSLAFSEIDRTLSETPDLLSEAQLLELAAWVDGPQVAADWLTLDGERAMFDDTIQRTYTDDGDGDGRLTPAGLRFRRVIHAQEIHTRAPTPSAVVRAVTAVVQPLVLVLSASRAELVREYGRIIGAREADWQAPLREASGDSSRRLRELQRSRLGTIRYVELVTLLPSVARAGESAERVLGQRDGLLVGIALERYRRQHGAYPPTLDALVPAFLDAVPADRITGEPVNYRLIETDSGEGTVTRPLVYSVGVDRVDDAGRSPSRYDDDDEPVADVHTAARWHDGDPLQSPSPVPRGDWVLFPATADWLPVMP